MKQILVDKKQEYDSQQKIVKNASTFSFFTILSRILGFSRELLKSFAFGTGPMAIAFDVAFRIPNMLRSLFAEGVMTQALLPIYESYKKQKDSSQQLRSLVSVVTIILVILSVAAWFLLPKIVPYLINDPELKEPHTLLTIRLSQILFPYLVFISISAIYTSIQYSHGVFWGGSFGPALANIITVAIFGGYLFHNYGVNKAIYGKNIYVFSYIILFSSIILFFFQKLGIKKKWNTLRLLLCAQSSYYKKLVYFYVTGSL